MSGSEHAERKSQVEGIARTNVKKWSSYLGNFKETSWIENKARSRQKKTWSQRNECLDY